MREYRQLTEEDRIEIYAMKQAGKLKVESHVTKVSSDAGLLSYRELDEVLRRPTVCKINAKTTS